MFPPLPAPEGLHPLVVHFPIALLFVVPLLIVFGLVFLRQRTGMFLAALIIMVVGTISAFVSVATGETAEVNAERVPAAHAVFEQHEELAETTRNVFALLTALFAALLVGPRLLKRHISPRTVAIAAALYLLPYMVGMTLLTNTSHLGARLVHEFGVRAPITGAGAAPAATIPYSSETEDD